MSLIQLQLSLAGPVINRLFYDVINRCIHIDKTNYTMCKWNILSHNVNSQNIKKHVFSCDFYYTQK